MKTEAPAYKRIVLKLSGEALQERGARENISPPVVREIAARIKEVHDLGVQTSVVIGGGKIFGGSARTPPRRGRHAAGYKGLAPATIKPVALPMQPTPHGGCA